MAVAWIFLAGPWASPQGRPQTGDVVLGVDGGLAHAQRLGLAVDCALGDFDSYRGAIPATALRYPRAKDATDFELALRWLAQHAPHIRMLSIVGGLGGAADHAFGNLWALGAHAFSALFWGADGPIAWLQRAEVRGVAAAGEKVSVYALTPLAALYYSGLRWPAPAALPPFSALASRNETVGGGFRVGWQRGQGLVYLPPQVRRLALNPIGRG